MNNRLIQRLLGLIGTCLAIVMVGTVVHIFSTIHNKNIDQNNKALLTINGSRVDYTTADEGGIIFRGRRYNSAQELAKSLGGSMKWNQNTGTIEIMLEPAQSYVPSVNINK
ncbi:hypothetical protein [Paenibacillus sp. J22TS3]|uniref:hypothetical protein n=1 Tax=Paenibacillus sp. J22TS3 TaxID=2807192 RepID=UPI001B0EF544|nr:hypothetical protein [Paenibacillus sp. J22TS3]GIP24155.1 hypothetical protein J22TS3_44300 [Paenibacillus sp. J22TS3]